MPHKSVFDDIAAMRLDQSFTEGSPTRRLQAGLVQVQKPNRHDFVRIHPGEDYRLAPVALVEVEKEWHIVMPNMVDGFPTKPTDGAIYTGITRQGTVFLWPIRSAYDASGKINTWNESSATAARAAMDRWVRVESNLQQKVYEIHEALGNIPDPAWPETPFSELLGQGFQGRVIETPDHPLVARLKGAA
jgi:hypothetical protein